MSESRKLFETVIKNNYCIGCGACSSVPNSPFSIKKDKFGNMIADGQQDAIDNSDAKVLAVCPFSGSSKNEDELGEMHFPENMQIDGKLGRFLACYAGYAISDKMRALGSSGGIGKWLGYTLLQAGKIDYFVQVVQNDSGKANDELFTYAIFDHPDSTVNGSTSAYYPTTLSEVISQIKKKEGKYAITGVPCFIKALRLLALQDTVLKERITFTIGIVCGGMKSANQSKMIAWQLGVHPKNLSRINFRGKDYGAIAATTKIYQVWSDQDDIIREKKSGDIFGADYGMGFFKPKACDFCDDVVGETADISIGDVWLPRYRFDTKGYSLVIVRNKQLLAFLKEGVYNGELFLEDLSAADAAKSQEGGFRHRRDALSYRLQKKEISGEWYPPKRVQPGEFIIEKKRIKIYALREKICDKSHTSFVDALEKDDLNIFYREMKQLMKKYNVAYNGVWIIRIANKIRRRLKRLLLR